MKLMPGITLAAILFLCLATTADAVERCLAVAKGPRLKSDIVRVAARTAQVQANEVRLTFVGHATFLIESPKGIRIATDYNDYVRPDVIPDIATMNRAHDTHFTNFPDPRIRHVLRGWNPDGGAAEHDITDDDVRVRNIATNIRGWDGTTARYGNSIFVFEIADLCIVHLGHLHHTLNPDQIAQIGQVDVLLVPVDGSYTLDLSGMMEVIRDLRAPLMIPMHYFSRFTLDRFLARARETYDIKEADTATLTLTRQMLPARQQILVLPGR